MQKTNGTSAKKAIIKNNPSDEMRQLEIWQDDDLKDGTLEPSLYGELMSAGSTGGWDPNDMFKFNEIIYNVTTTYDDQTMNKNYTIPLACDVNGIAHKPNKGKVSRDKRNRAARHRIAAMIAQEIEDDLDAMGRVTPESSDDDEIYKMAESPGKKSQNRQPNHLYHHEQQQQQQQQQSDSRPHSTPFGSAENDNSSFDALFKKLMISSPISQPKQPSLGIDVKAVPDARDNNNGDKTECSNAVLDFIQHFSSPIITSSPSTEVSTTNKTSTNNHSNPRDIKCTPVNRLPRNSSRMIVSTSIKQQPQQTSTISTKTPGHDSTKRMAAKLGDEMVAKKSHKQKPIQPHQVNHFQHLLRKTTQQQPRRLNDSQITHSSALEVNGACQTPSLSSSSSSSTSSSSSASSFSSTTTTFSSRNIFRRYLSCTGPVASQTNTQATFPKITSIVLELLGQLIVGTRSQGTNSHPDLTNSIMGDDNWNFWWSYMGPSYWGLLNPDWHMCDRGRLQSPIDIDPATIVYDPNLGPLKFDNEKSISGILTNDGHSLVLIAHRKSHNNRKKLTSITTDAPGTQVHRESRQSLPEQITDSELTPLNKEDIMLNRIERNINENEKFIRKNVSHDSSIVFSGAGLAYNYRFSRLFIRFGSHDHEGSEHRVMSRAFPAELQLFAYNSDLYRDYREATTKPSGLLAISVFVDTDKSTASNSSSSNKPPTRGLSSLLDHIKHVRYRGTNVTINGLTIGDLLTGADGLITYEGSLTTPGCHESTTWIILNKPLYINQEQINELRSVSVDEAELSSGTLMANNLRPCQAINNRLVRTNIVFRGNDPKQRMCRRLMTRYSYSYSPA
ncbi:putative carbonic anhydrase-like protein 1 [Fragariocoptes setiger]|uniref:Carbonic anhydrase-like protein 1 n=1 Tax=Fragariocoptes setiger TaxID=1670756 RepID=A0ABQ7S6X3_9ACAR|nr:putative carbonic anhydrase-like protein 1 [Fragariocoptes setiger]